MFSVVILTLNEARNLPRTLASLGACNDVVVLDSGSTDDTAEIAQKAGARVVVNRFENFAQQRNFAHTSISFKNSWIFHLDADEHFTPELQVECARIGADDPAMLDGYMVAPRMHFRGRWIPHCTDFPAYQARFVHATRFRFIQIGHGQREAADMRLEYLKSHYIHDLSSHSEDDLRNKHRRYAREEAAAFEARTHGAAPRLTELWSGDRLQRRRALKHFSQYLPARNWLRFFYQYVLRRGFLDGAAGLAYCRLLADYEGWVTQEIRSARGRKAP